MAQYLVECGSGYGLDAVIGTERNGCCFFFVKHLDEPFFYVFFNRITLLVKIHFPVVETAAFA